MVNRCLNNQDSRCQLSKHRWSPPAGGGLQHSADEFPHKLHCGTSCTNAGCLRGPMAVEFRKRGARDLQSEGPPLPHQTVRHCHSSSNRIRLSPGRRTDGINAILMFTRNGQLSGCNGVPHLVNTFGTNNQRSHRRLRQSPCQ